MKTVRIRRAPKIATFLILGGAVGAIVTLALTTSFPVDPNVGFGPLYAYFLLFGIPAGPAAQGFAQAQETCSGPKSGPCQRSAFSRSMMTKARCSSR
jgi:hypothetical protein